MKILLQIEARTISNYELATNQQTLINMITTLHHVFLRLRLPKKAFKTNNFES